MEQRISLCAFPHPKGVGRAVEKVCLQLAGIPAGVLFSKPSIKKIIIKKIHLLLAYGKVAVILF